MSELRNEAINLIEKMPEEYLLAIVQYADVLKTKALQMNRQCLQNGSATQTLTKIKLQNT